MSNIDKHAVQAVADLKAGYTLGHADVAILNELARIALASLEAEAVGEVVLGEYDDCGCHPDARVACIAADGQADWENFKDGTRLYTAPPAPVSVPDDESESEMKWRDLALQFDGHRMQSLCFLKYILSQLPETEFVEAREFLKSGPLPGEEVLRNRIAAMLKAGPVTAACKLRDAVEIIRSSGIEIDADKIFAELDALNAPDCWCRTCRPVTISDMRFVVCPVCGNKRCPHANDHRNACTGSNEPGQEGGAYPAAPQQEAKNV